MQGKRNTGAGLVDIMWLFTKSGFFSAVQHREAPDLVIVRARWRKDLQALLVANGNPHGVVIHSSPCADYPYRATMKKETWARMVAAEAERVDYDNFKDAAHDGTARDAALLKCWAAMRAAEDPRKAVGAFLQHDYLASHR